MGRSSAKENYKKKKNAKKQENMKPVYIAMSCIVLFMVAVVWLLIADDSVSSTNKGNEDTALTQPAEKDEPKITQYERPKKGETIAEMHIRDYGIVKIRLFDSITPKAVKNFVEHSKEGYYDGVTFHRVIEDFMIQGGDPEGTGRGGESIWGKPFEDEYSKQLFPIRGALCMANAGANTNGSQFFIVTADDCNEQYASMYKNVVTENIYNYLVKEGGSAHLYKKHTVFGHVYEGMDTIDKISKTKTDSADKPVSDVIIEKIVISEAK